MKLVKKILWSTLIIISTGIVLLAASIPFSRWESLPGPEAQDPGPYLIKNIHIVDLESETIQENSAVLINGRQITAILSADQQPPPGTRILDGQGAFAMPGLIDMHSHLFSPSYLPAYLATGVTTVRNMMGFPMHLRWREKLRTGEWAGPRLITASPTLNSGNDLGPFHKEVGSPEEASRLVAAYKEAGYDFIKVYDGLDADTFEAVALACRDLDIPFAGHYPRDLSLARFAESGILSLEHAEELFQGPLGRRPATEPMSEAARILADNRIALSPTLVAYHRILAVSDGKQDLIQTLDDARVSPFLSFVGNKQLADWALVEDNELLKIKYQALENLTRICEREGVPLIFGTDVGPNLLVPDRAVQEEIKLNLAAGLSSGQVLRSATVAPARVLGKEHQLGRIREGYIADILLLSNNPLLDPIVATNPEMVIRTGTLYDKAALEKLRKAALDHDGTYKTIGRLLEHKSQL